MPLVDLFFLALLTIKRFVFPGLLLSFVLLKRITHKINALQYHNLWNACNQVNGLY
jgi:hypothetical protein